MQVSWARLEPGGSDLLYTFDHVAWYVHLMPHPLSSMAPCQSSERVAGMLSICLNLSRVVRDIASRCTMNCQGRQVRTLADNLQTASRHAAACQG